MLLFSLLFTGNYQRLAALRRGNPRVLAPQRAKNSKYQRNNSGLASEHSCQNRLI